MARHSPRNGYPQVMMLPDGSRPDDNLYVFLLRRSLESLAVRFSLTSRLLALVRPPTILHVHWPHNYASSNRLPVAAIKSAFLVAACLATKLNGGKIIWTVHDFESLNGRNRLLESIVMKVFVHLVDGLVFLTEVSRTELNRVRRATLLKPSQVIPHATFEDAYPAPTSKLHARRRWGIREDVKVVSCVGAIKPYKNVELLIQAAKICEAENMVVLLAGHCSDLEYATNLKQMILDNVDRGVAIRWIDQSLTDSELADIIDASDEVALTYRTTWNSGMAVLILERGRPVIATTSPGFADLATSLGGYWVKAGNDDVTTLARTLSRVSGSSPSSRDILAQELFLQTRSQEAVGRATLEFYQHVLSSPVRVRGRA